MSEHIGEAVWRGGLKEGEGKITVESGGFTLGYGFSSRFGEGKGTSPEELVGAAHAACFSMALAAALEKAGHPPEEIKTQDRVRLEKQEGGYAITEIHVITEGKVPGIKEENFQKVAEEVKRTCPVSKALSGTKITLSAALRTDQC